MSMKGFFVKCALIFVIAFSTAIAPGVPAPALAHFQMVYTPDAVVEPGTKVETKIVFTHPFNAGHTMDMEAPKDFFVIHKGQKTDLLDSLRMITWESLTNKGNAYEASYTVRSMGDYIFCLVPAPYYEEHEDCYIQQFVKSYVNVAGMPTDWDNEIGMPAEIVPLDKPYAIWEGSTFRGIVMGNGKSVPFAEIEVEYLNYEPLMGENRFHGEAKAVAPLEAMETLTIKANASGEFVFGIPREGWWGFCALGVGPVTEIDGKDLSQDAVIWVCAYEMK